MWYASGFLGHTSSTEALCPGDQISCAEALCQGDQILRAEALRQGVQSFHRMAPWRGSERTLVDPHQVLSLFPIFYVKKIFRSVMLSWIKESLTTSVGSCRNLELNKNYSLDNRRVGKGSAHLGSPPHLGSLFVNAITLWVFMLHTPCKKCMVRLDTQTIHFRCLSAHYTNPKSFNVLCDAAFCLALPNENVGNWASRRAKNIANEAKSWKIPPVGCLGRSIGHP